MGSCFSPLPKSASSRLKHDSRFPHLAIQACLDFAQVRAQDIDEVCFGWQSPAAAYRHDLKFFCHWRSAPLSYLSLLTSTRHFPTIGTQHGGAKTLLPSFSRQQSAHSFRRSPLCPRHQRLCLLRFRRCRHRRDGRPQRLGSHFHLARQQWSRSSTSSPFPGPIPSALFTPASPNFSASRPTADEWKVIGLAPYGQPGIDLRPFLDLATIPYHVHTSNLVGNGARGFSGLAFFISGAPRASRKATSPIATKILPTQCKTSANKPMVNVVRARLGENCCSNHLCLAGGVALNSKANGKLVASGIVDNLFVQPAASDDGVALGAALAPVSSTMAGSSSQAHAPRLSRPVFPRRRTSPPALSHLQNPLSTRLGRSSRHRRRTSVSRAKFLAGIKAAWNLGRVPLAAAPSSPILAIRR